MKIIETYNGYCDANFYGVCVWFKLGARTLVAYCDLFRDEDKLNSPIEVTDGESTLPVEIPAAFKSQILKAAIAYKNS